jgi:hypothetical protein
MKTTKEEILKTSKWEEFKGFCFPSPRCDEQYDLTFVSVDDTFAVLSKGVQTYWWNNSHERLMDLEEAWEYFTEDYCEEHDISPENQEECDEIVFNNFKGK